MRISDWSSDVCSSDLLGEWSDRVQDRQSQYGVCHFRTEPGEQEISDSQLRRSISLFGYRHGILGLCASSSANWRSWCWRSEEHTSELQSLMRISYAVFCLKKNITQQNMQ